MSDHLEVRLLRWSESSQAGRTVTFLLPDDGEHPFKGLRFGKTGDRFAMALAKIEDKEAKADHIFGPDGYTSGSGPKEKSEKSPGERARVRAVLLCENAEFRQWLKSWSGWAGPITPEVAAKIMRETCDIQSRRDIAADPVALERFLDLEAQFVRREQIR